MKNIVKVIFALLVLSCFSFHQVLASIEGGNGKVVGIKEGDEYLISSVTMSGDGDLCSGEELDWFTLDATNNSNLAGLYYVKENENSDATLIYVNGETAEKRYIGVTDTDSGLTSFGDGLWQAGVWTGGALDGDGAKLDSYYYFYHSSGHGLDAFNNATLSVLPSSSKVSTLPDIADKTAEETAMVEAQINVMNAVNSLSFRYAYRSEEIIPASDFRSFSFSERQKTGGIRFYKNTDTANKAVKLRVYIATPTGEIEVYEATDDVSAGKYASTSTSTVKTTHEITASELISLSTNYRLSDVETGYVVGVEIFPRIIDDYTKIYKSSTSKTTNFEIQINYGEEDYVFSSPAFMPTGAYFDEESGRVSSLENGREYYLSAVSINDFVNVETAKVLTSNEKGEIDLSGEGVGLYTLFSKPLYEEYENTVSKPLLIYLPDSKETQELVGVSDDENGTTVTAGDGVTEWCVGAWSNAGKINGVEKGVSYDVSASASSEVYIREGYSVDLSGTSLPSSPQSTATESQLDYQKALECFSFKYAYRQGEIIPSAQLGAISFVPYIAQGTVDYGSQIIDSAVNTYTKIVVYTINKNGRITVFSAVSDTPASPDLSEGKVHTVSADTLLCGDGCISDDDGYVVGIEIFPMLVNRPEHLTYMSGVPTHFALRFIYGGEKGYCVKSVPDAPEVSVLDGGDAFCIMNFDPSLNYEYSTDGERWNAVVSPEKTPMTKASTQYFVRVARDSENTCSKASCAVSSPVVTSGISLALNGYFAICIGLDGGVSTVKFFDENGIALDASKYMWNSELSAFLLKVPPKDYENKFFTYVYSFTDKEGRVTEVRRTTKTASYYLDEADTDTTKALKSFFRVSKLYFDEGVTVSDFDAVLLLELDAYYNSIMCENTPSPSFTTDDPDFTFMGTSLILDGSIKLRHYFKLNKTPDSFSLGVELAGEKIADLSAESEDGLFYADIDCKGISGYNNQYTLTVENKETLKKTQITYGICDFTKNMVVNKTRDEKVYYLSLAIYSLFESFSNN